MTPRAWRAAAEAWWVEAWGPLRLAVSSAVGLADVVRSAWFLSLQLWAQLLPEWARAKVAAVAVGLADAARSSGQQQPDSALLADDLLGLWRARTAFWESLNLRVEPVAGPDSLVSS
jgi:hypothetical protein